MLKRLQLKYARQPVRFLLVPCNQFGAQEPKSNADVKAFAETYLDLSPGSNVLMLAKSNLNSVPCTTTGSDSCMPSSKECCPANDPIYNYLLSVAPPGNIKWNFDKIVVDTSGKPLPGESILHGGDVDSALETAFATAGIDLSISAEAAGLIHSDVALFLVLGAAVVTAAVGLKIRQHKRKQQEPLPNYVLMC